MSKKKDAGAPVTMAQVMAKLKKAKGTKKIDVGEVASDLEIPIHLLKTGSLYLDYVAGGGFQYGKFHEIYGDESSGKTTAVLEIIAQAIRDGKKVAWLDAEYSWDRDYAEERGVDPGMVIVAQEDRVEKATEIIKMWLEAGIEVIVIDSVAALRPLKEIEDDPGKTQYGGNSKSIAKLCYQCRGPVARANAVLIAINQVRINMGPQYGAYDKHRAPGGKTWKHTIATSLEFIKMGDILDDGYNDHQDARSDTSKTTTKASQLTTGHKTVALSRKNKLGNVRGRNRTLFFDYEHGLDVVVEVAQVAKRFNLVDMKGSWITFINENGEEERLQGFDNFVDRLREDMTLYESLYPRCEQAIANEVKAREEAARAKPPTDDEIADLLSQSIPEEIA